MGETSGNARRGLFWFSDVRQWLVHKREERRKRRERFRLAVAVTLIVLLVVWRLTRQDDEERAVADEWAIALSWWVPRKYREDLIGDILEDCREMRTLGMKERRIILHVAYQWLIGVVMLVPTALTTRIAGAIRQIIVTRK